MALNKIVEQILQRRGISAAELVPKYEFGDVKLPGVEAAADRVIKAAEKGEKVLIYGDYDVDGVTASAIMADTLRACGVQDVSVMLPDRFKDGYGMSLRAVERAKELGVSLVVTVDCGSSNADVIAELAEAGIETIVTDHHEITTSLPDCIVVNGKAGECGDLRELCGAGTAFMLARELVGRGVISKGQEKWLLDLVYIGTVADSMEMRGTNRMLSYWGSRVLAKTRRRGLIEMMRACKLSGILGTEKVGFIIGPRLNAAGRMANAEIAYNLLASQSSAEAVKLYAELDALNSERKKAQGEAVDEVFEAVSQSEEPVIVVRGVWHEGVIGIVAGKLTEIFKKPAFVVTESKGLLKASGRSFGEFNLAEALVECKDLFVRYGGHAGACGFSMEAENFEEFKRRVNEYYESLGLVEQERFLERDADVTLSDFSELTEGLVGDLALLEPFGPGNEEPLFCLENVLVTGVRWMGQEGNHLALTLVDARGKTLRAVKFYASGIEITEGERVDIYGVPGVNEFNGTKSVEFRFEKIVKK